MVRILKSFNAPGRGIKLVAFMSVTALILTTVGVVQAQIGTNSKKLYFSSKAGTVIFDMASQKTTKVSDQKGSLLQYEQQSA